MSNGKESDTIPARKQENPNEFLYRVRISQVPVAIALPIVISLVGFVGAVLVGFYTNQDALSERFRASIIASERSSKDYTDQQVQSIRGSLEDFRDYAKEVHNRQDEIIKWNHKALMQVIK